MQIPATTPISDWLVQLTWFAAALGATGAFWYFLNNKQYRTATMSAVATVLLVLLAVSFHRTNDAFKRRIDRSEQSNHTGIAQVAPAQSPMMEVRTPHVDKASAVTLSDGAEEAAVAEAGPAYSPMTMDEYFDTWFHKATTSLQRDELERNMLNRRVVWQGVVRNIEPRTDGSLQVLVYAENSTSGAAFLEFDTSQRAELLKLNPKDVIRFTGVIHSFISSAFLRKCKLLRVVSSFKGTNGSGS